MYFERAPKKRKALTLWVFIGILRRLEIIKREHSRKDNDCNDFLERMKTKKVFTRKRQKKYKQSLRRRLLDEDVQNN